VGLTKPLRSDSAALQKRNMGATGQLSGQIAAVDLFCGVGGLTYGLKAAGISVRAGVDVDRRCAFPYEQNCGARFVHRDVRELTGRDLDALYEDAPVRVLAGCAPCQPFSTYSQSRKSVDGRWELLNEYVRLAEEVKPQVLTLENVAGLAGKEIWSSVQRRLKEAGYNLSWREVACDQLGLPQRRKRLVLLGSRLGAIRFDTKAFHSEPMTVRQAIAHLPPLGAGAAHPGDPLHAASSLSPINLRRIKASAPGRTWRDWPAALRAACHLRKSGETYPAVYGRMEWDKPAPTITTQFYGFGNGRFGHPEQDRAITIREAAILQSFPESYQFIRPGEIPTFRHLGIMIGNAVPPRLGEAIGRSILDHVQAASF